MRISRATWYILLTLLTCILAVGATRSLTRAQSSTSIVGLLAMLEAATDNSPAVLRFYTPDAQLVHELPLPTEIAISDSALAPDGRHFAYHSGDVSGPEAAARGEPLQHDLTLHILSAVDGSEVATLPLLPANFPANVAINADLLLARDPTLDEFDDPEEAVWQAFRYSLGIFAWSPDGTQLAYSSAIDGPSSDLYLYDTTTGENTRLTDGLEQIYSILWSPDGAWIWHSTISYGYCQACGGHNYAAAADGSRVINLPGDDIYRFLAWTDNTHYLVTDQSNGPGDFALQLVDITTGRSEMLWAGTHQAFIYDAAQERLAIIGTRGQTFDPNEQVFVIDLATGDESEHDVTEYEDLTSAAAVEGWLAPLQQRPVTHRCGRAGPIIDPCIDTPYDPLSPNGAYLVTDRFAVVETASGAEILPRESELAAGRILWRPDNIGFFITQPNLAVYRDLATGEYTVTESGAILGWLPHAAATTFAAAPAQVPPAPPPIATSIASPTAEAIATAAIDIPFRSSTLEGDFLATGARLRAAQASELATLAQSLATGTSAADEAARAEGLPLLLAHEAARTYLYPSLPQPLEPMAYNPALEAELNAALDAALATSAPIVAQYPAGGKLPTLTSVALSPDGSVLATSDNAGNVRLWDYASGTMRRVLPTSTRTIHNLTFSSDGMMLAAVDYGGQVQMWHVASGIKSSTHFAQSHWTMSAAWRPGSYDLAVTNGPEAIQLHPASQRAHALLVEGQPVSGETLAYSPDGSQLAIALTAHYPPLDATDARQAITAEERPIWIVDADTGRVLHELMDDRATYAMSYTPDGATLVVMSAYLLRAWDVASATLLFETELPDFANGWAITPDGTQLAILSRRAGVSFFDLRSGENVRNMPVDASVLAWLAIHPTDGTLISGDFNGRPLLIDPESGAYTFRFGPPRARLATVSKIAPLLATADTHTITLFDLDTQTRLHELAGAENLITSMTFSPDGAWLAAREETGEVLLWAVESGALQWRVAVSSEWAGRIAFAPDGQLLTGGSDGVLRLVNPANGAVVGAVELNAQILSIAASPYNEATVVIGRPISIAVRVDLAALAANQRGLQTLAEAAAILGPAAYSPDGLLLAILREMSGEVDNEVDDGPESALIFLDTATGETVQRIDMDGLIHASALAFSPDGTLFATGATEYQPVTLWEVATGRQVQTIGDAATIRPSTSVAFSPDGTQLLVSDERAVTTQYSLDSNALSTRRVDPAAETLAAKATLAAARVPRAPAEFTAAERARYAIDTFVGTYALSASGNINLRPQPYLKSLIVQPTASSATVETLVALTNEKFLLTSTDQGERWRIVTRLPLTLTTHSLGIPARADDPLLLATEQGLYRVEIENGALTLIHRDALRGVSYSHTNPQELWAVRRDKVYKSEDGGVTWGEASNELTSSELFAPLLLAPPNNNPQIVAGFASDRPILTYWRGAGNGFWEQMPTLPILSSGVAGEVGMAWDASNRTLYLGGTGGLLYAATVDAPNAAAASASIVENFGLDTRPVPLAVGQGPSLYLNLITSSGPRWIRGFWDGSAWTWVELRLPVVAAG